MTKTMVLAGIALALSTLIEPSGFAAPRPTALISKTISFPVSSLEKVEQTLTTAAARPADQMQTDVVYTIDSNLQMRCASGAPDMIDGRLYGCVLQTRVDLGGGAVATLQNLLSITQSSSDVNALLAKTDANQVAQVQLTSPFDGGHGSNYYCNAEGAAGTKTWACYLNFVD